MATVWIKRSVKNSAKLMIDASWKQEYAWADNFYYNNQNEATCS